MNYLVMSNQQQKTSWLTGLLTGWGIRESWAKIIAGAIMGALTAAGILTSTSCNASYTQSPNGTIHLTGTVCYPIKQQK